MKTSDGLVMLNGDQVRPLFHLDFHGKFPKKEWAGEIDIGGKAAEYFFGLSKDKDEAKFILELKQRLSDDIDEIYKGIVLGHRELRPQSQQNCRLHGFWGPERHTMSSQSSMLGIPSF